MPRPPTPTRILVVTAALVVAGSTLVTVWVARSLSGPVAVEVPESVAFPTATTRPVDLLGTDPTPALAAVAGGIDVPPVRELIVYREYLVAEVATTATALDRWVVWPGQGRTTGPDPVRNVPADLADQLFTASEVDLSLVPRLGADAIRQLQIDAGEVTHVIIGRQLPFDEQVGFSVYVTGPRESGYVRFDAAGSTFSVNGRPVGDS
ncbi:MAG TPA: hypothetical protein VK866_10445 [Acidimicrobiales bacterium]|nr:hypothetical protein [Acidimicrobiales bacterium]